MRTINGLWRKRLLWEAVAGKDGRIQGTARKGTHMGTNRCALSGLMTPVVPAVLWLAILMLACTGLARADADPLRSYGGAVYVPAFSYLPRSETAVDPLASTLVVHNVDPQRSITLTAVDFFDSTGAKVTAFLQEPIRLTPFQSRDFFIGQRAAGGSTGNNFVVRWEAAEAVIEPLMIALMHGGSGTQGLSFTTTGRVIERREPPAE